MRYFLESPYVSIVALIVGLCLVTQIVKLGARGLGLRHHFIVEKSLFWVPIALGVFLGSTVGEAAGLSVLVQGAKVPVMLGLLYGGAAGVVASVLFKALKAAVPKDSKCNDILAVYDDAFNPGGGEQ